LGVAAEAGREEHQPLDVVEVEVGEENADRRVLGDAEAEGPDPGASVEDQPLAAAEGHLDAGGVAAVAVHPRPRTGDRAPRTPNLHPPALASVAARGHQRIIAPVSSAPDPTSGNALASIVCSAPSTLRMQKRPWAGRRSRSAIVSGRSSIGIGSRS